MKKLKKYSPFYLMLLPGSIYLIINNYIPMTGLVIAFKKYNFQDGIYGSPFVGLKNFKFLFRTNDAWLITRNTLLYNLAFIVLGTVLSVAVAVLLNEIRSKRAKKCYQTVLLIPYLISIIVVSYLVYAFLAVDKGFINNSILRRFGGEAVNWYGEPKYWPFILILVEMWKITGYKSIVYFSTIIGFDPAYYEAARVDGAGRWQQIRFITLPALKTTVVILTLMSLGRIFYTDFGLFYHVPMNQGTLMNVTNTIDTYVYRGLMNNSDIGMTAAAGFYQSVIGFMVVFTANWIVRKTDGDSALF